MTANTVFPATAGRSPFTPSRGALLGVSLGPGDPGLITRQSWDALLRADVWAYPVRKAGSDSYALDIVQRAGLTPPSQTLPLVFPMTHDTGILARYWMQAAQAVLALMAQGQTVVFLVEGDASTYSTWNHLARTVRALEDTADLRTLAGVPSHHAAAARAGWPLVDGDDTLAILPAAYGVAMIETLLPAFDTLVLLKVKPLLDEILDLLAARQLLEHARFIEKCGTPDERLVSDLHRLRGEKVHYLSLLLVRNPGREKAPRQPGCRQKMPEAQG